jgi:carbon-monoxide dehydrogenase medium subunit
MLRRFHLHEPESIKDVPALLAKYGENGAILAGGTELLLVMKQGMVNYEHLININTISELDKIFYDPKEGVLRIGPLVTHRDLETFDLILQGWPVIVEMEKQIANIRIRNAGTVAGNLCFSEPRSDVGALLLALKTRVKVEGTQGERLINLDDFFLDFYETSMEQDEMLTEIQIPNMPQHSSGAYLRFALSEWPTVGVAVILTFDADKNDRINNAAIILSSVNPIPLRAQETEIAIKGSRIREVLAGLDEIGEIAKGEVNPIGDMHASEWYKREMVKTLVKRAITIAFSRWVQ